MNDRNYWDVVAPQYTVVPCRGYFTFWRSLLVEKTFAVFFHTPKWLLNSPRPVTRKETSCPRFAFLVNSLLNKYGTEQLFILTRRTKKFWTFAKRWVFSIAEGKRETIRNKFWPVNLNIPCPLRASSWICMRAMWGFEHSTSTSSRVFGEHLGPALRWQEQHARMMQDWICKSKKDNDKKNLMMIIIFIMMERGRERGREGC